jgi:hypothetical protein
LRTLERRVEFAGRNARDQLGRQVRRHHHIVGNFLRKPARQKRNLAVAVVIARYIFI